MPQLNQENVDWWFSYHAPKDDAQMAAYKAIRAAGKALAETVLEYCPDSADKTVAIRTIREAVMWANASVACEGR